MVHALLRINVQDFDAFWEEFQNRGYVLRQSNGSLGTEIFLQTGEPNRVIILSQWDTNAHLEQFMRRWPALLTNDRACVGTLETLCLVEKLGEMDA